MKTIDIISFAFKNMKQKRTQSLLTITGIVIGVLAIVSLISIGYGVQNYMHEEMMKMGANKLTILPLKQFGVPPSHYFTDREVKAIKRVKGVDALVYGWYAGCDIEYNGEKAYVSYFYSNPSDMEKVYSETGYNIEKGRWLKDNDGYKCIIGYGTAYVLFNKEIKVGDTIKIKDKKYSIKNVLHHINKDQEELKQLELDLQKYNSQYNKIEIKEFKNSHDRFLVIDDKEIFHIGASLKDLGKKVFAFSKIEDLNNSIIINLVK